ncbi:MAG: hypothetical protein D6776_08870 [Planctomycetota bacterium]|nr:MAG: hypothetical protein D6776_08870 [Planctomycetota bacterium]
MWSDLERQQQRRRLEEARRDRALIEVLPRVVAAGFGVIPIGRIPGGLELACAPTLTPRATRALEKVIGLRVRTVAMDEALVHVYISRLYLEGAAVDFQTFLSPDFLEDPAAWARLRTEKDGAGLTVQWSPPEDAIVALDYAYRTVLRSLDHGHREPRFAFEAGPLELGFELVAEGDGPALLLEAEQPPGDEVAVLARESYCVGGLEHRHGWRVHALEGAPFMIHPSEVQIVGLRPDGALRLWVYDRTVDVRPGERPVFSLTYYFLSMGQRLERQLEVQIHDLALVPRRRVRALGAPIPWTGEHLRRWLGVGEEPGGAGARRGGSATGERARGG